MAESGIIDQEIDRRSAIARRSVELMRRARLSKIDLTDGDCLISPFHCRRHRLQPVTIPPHQQKIVPPICQGPGIGRPDPPRGSGDDGKWS